MTSILDPQHNESAPHSPPDPCLAGVRGGSGRILWAGDAADLHESIERLQEQGFEVQRVADGRRALEAAQSHPPDLVLSDGIMPVGDGASLLTALRADPRLRDIPVLLLCAHEGEDGRGEGWQDGADGFLVKPFSGRELMAHVEAQIKMTRLRAQMKRSLQQSEERYRAIVEGQAEMVCRFRPDGVILFVNGAYARARGTTPERLLGVNFWTFIDEADRPAVRALLDQLRPDAPEVRIENRFETAEGVRWTLWTNRGFTFDDQGRATEVQSAGIDITERKQAEAALQRSEAEFRTLFELSAVGSVQAEPSTGRFLRVNRRFCEITGYSEAELLTLSFHALTHPADHERELAVVLPVQRGEADRWEIEKRFVRADGEIVWVHVAGRLISDADGQPYRTTANIADITERKRNEQALRDSEAKLSAILQGLPVGVGVTDTQGRTRSLNPAGLRLHGFTSLDEMFVYFEQYQSQFELRSLDGRLLPVDEWPLARALRGDYVHNCEVRLQPHADAPERIVSYSAVPIVDHQDGSDQIIFVMNDVTDRKQAEENLRQSERHLALVINTVAALIAHFDGEGRFQFANRAYAEQLGLAPADIVGKHMSEVLGPASYAAVQPHIVQALAGHVVKFETEVNHPVLGQRYMSTCYAPEVDDKGKVRGFVATVTDITERRRMENALRQLNETLEERVDKRTQQVRQLTSRLTIVEQEERQRLAQILHDSVQQMLYAIGFRAVLLRQEFDTEQEGQVSEHLAEITRLAENAAAVTRDLSHELAPPVLDGEDVASLVQWLAEHMRNLHTLETRVSVQSNARLPDKNRRIFLLQIVRELLFNVVKHAGVRQAEILVTQRNRSLQIVVRDEGKGIDVDSLHGDAKGGLGLASIAERLRLYRGEMHIHSTPQGGTEITVLLPP